MKIIAIEPTPSPNNMKVIVDETFSEKGQTFEHAFGAPDHVAKLLEIPGIKSVYQVSDFLAVERFPKYDWRTLVIEIRRSFGEILSDVERHETDEAFEPVHLFIQFILGIFTLLFHVPLWLGLAHQIMAFFLLTAMTFTLHRFTK